MANRNKTAKVTLLTHSSRSAMPGLPIVQRLHTFVPVRKHPAGPVETCRSFLSASGGLPCRPGRSAPALRVSRIARRSLTLWPACSLTPQREPSPGVLQSTCYLREPLQVLPVGATSYRAGFAPARINMPFTAHRPTRATGLPFVVSVARCARCADTFARSGLTVLSHDRQSRQSVWGTSPWCSYDCRKRPVRVVKMMSR